MLAPGNGPCGIEDIYELTYICKNKPVKVNQFMDALAVALKFSASATSGRAVDGERP